jgi:hypothetical protein
VVRRIVGDMKRRAICGVVLVGAVVVAGCGSSEKTTSKPKAPPASASGPAGVIKGWADSLRSGNVKAAARYFALPARVSNGGGAVRLTSRDSVEAFNATLPCGAKVVSTRQIAKGFTLATFELTERPGAGTCGSGVGDTASVAIRVRKGKITDWRRANDLPKVPAQTA